MKLLNAIRIGWFFFRNPLFMNPDNLQSMVKVMQFILDVGKWNRPMMTQFGMFHFKTKEFVSIVNLWAGPSIDSCPTERIKELIKENQELRSELHKQPNTFAP